MDVFLIRVNVNFIGILYFAWITEPLRHYLEHSVVFKLHILIGFTAFSRQSYPEQLIEVCYKHPRPYSQGQGFKIQLRTFY